MTVGIESQPHNWVTVEIWRQARRMQEVMAVQLGSSVEVIVRQVVGVGSGGYGVMVGGRGVSAKIRGARRVRATVAIVSEYMLIERMYTQRAWCDLKL